MRLCLISGAMLREQFGQLDRLLTELFPNQLVATGCLVTFIKQQVERVQYAIETPGQLIANWNLKWNTRLLDFLFCACQSFGNRRFSCQESPTDLDDAETAERFQ